MDCPACKNAVITLDLSDVEIDHCFSCGGIWLDAGELELLLQSSQAAAQLISSFHKDQNCREKLRPCPICRGKMDKIIVGNSAKPLLIDRCSKGHGLWFDKDELQNIFDKASLDKDNKIQKLLADMFGSKQNTV
jgi:Zn-finger nucleic acid-binding protein